MLRLLGLEESGAIEFYRLYLRSSLPWLVAVLLMVAGVVLAVSFYKRVQGLSKKENWALSILRAALIVLLVLVLFEPVSGVQMVEDQQRMLLVLLDVSRSMGIADARESTLSLEDAAMALGKVPFPAPVVREHLAAAARQLRLAAQAIRSDDQPACKAALELAGRNTAAAVEVAASDNLSNEMLSRLREFDEQLREAATSAARQNIGPDAAAALVSELLAELATLDAHIRLDAADYDDYGSEEIRSATRIDLARGVLDHRRQFFQSLEDEIRVRYLCFGEGVYPVDRDGKAGESLLTMEAADEATQLGTALTESASRYAGQSIAGIVVLTDGGSNKGPDPLDAARMLRRLNIPVFPIAFGDEEPDDVAASRLIVQETVFSRDSVPVRVQIDSHGYAGEETDLVLRIGEQEKARKSITLQGGTQFEELEFTPGNIIGNHEIEVWVEPLPGEVTLANNRIGQTVRVIDEKIKVLYVESAPRWEYRYLRAVLTRDHRLDVNFLITEGDMQMARASEDLLTHYPNQAEDAFEYDVVLLGDVPADYFSTEQLEWMEELVRERGGSFMMMAGQRYAPHSYANTPVESLLPVELDGKTEQVDETVHPVPTRDGLDSMLAYLDTDEIRNHRLWSDVRPLRNVPRLAGTKPGATVLLELSDSPRRTQPYPLISWQRYGSGKSMFIGTDQLWRLRYERGDRYHARFWGQAIQFLTLSRLLGENKQIRIETDKLECYTGEEVQVFANVLNEAYAPVIAPSFTVYVQPPDGASEQTFPIELKPVSNTPGLYHEIYVPSREGIYRIEVEPELQAVSNRVELRARQIEREMLNPAMNRELLEQIAELSGGRFLNIRDVPALPGMLDKEPFTVTIRREISLWDSWIVLIIVVLLAGTEWYFRRRRNLV